MHQSIDERSTDIFFVYALEIEIKIGQLYKEFSTMFSDMPAIAAYWKDLLMDVMDYIKALRKIKESIDNEQVLPTIDDKIWDDVNHVRKKLDRDLLQSVNNLDDAYELAHELESSEVNAIFQFLTKKFMPKEERVKFVVSTMKNHQKKLMDFSENFGSKAWRKGINAS